MSRHNVSRAASLAAAMACLSPAVEAATACYPAPSGLMGWWRGKGNAVDSAGFNDGVLYNGATFAGGLVGMAFSFNGVNQYMAVGRTTIMPPTASITETAWFNVISRVGSYDPIVGGDDAAGWGYGIEFDGAPLSFWICSDAGACYSVVAPNTIPLKTWMFVAATWDGATLSLSLNGKLANTSKTPTFMNGPMTSFHIAGNTTLGRYSNALIDEVALFNRALSPAEVAGIYNSRGAGMCALPNERWAPS